MKRPLVNRVFYGVVGALAGTTLGLAVTGGFPDGVQDPLANAVRHVGINLPGGADVHPVARIPARSETEEGKAFSVPKGGTGEAQKRSPSRGGYESSCYASAACREYFGIEEDEPEDEAVRYVPPPQSDGGGYNPGQLGEPGQPGIPDEGSDDPGESDGTPGEAGPAGDPG